MQIDLFGVLFMPIMAILGFMGLAILAKSEGQAKKKGVR